MTVVRKTLQGSLSRRLPFNVAVRAMSLAPQNATPNSGLLLDATIINPKNHKATVIWLHGDCIRPAVHDNACIGLGDSAHGFSDLFRSLKLPDTRVVLPNAPMRFVGLPDFAYLVYRPVSVNRGAVMRAWYVPSCAIYDSLCYGRYDIYSLGNREKQEEDEEGIKGVR